MGFGSALSPQLPSLLPIILFQTVENKIIVNELGGNLSQAGLAMTLFMLSAIAIRPFSGLIIEKFGVKKTLYVSEIMFCLCSVAYIFVDSLMFLLVLRFLHGIWFSIVTTVTVPIANNFIPDSRKGEGMGYFLVSVNLGIVLGPLIGLSLIQSVSYASISTLLSVSVWVGFPFRIVTGKQIGRASCRERVCRYV